MNLRILFFWQHICESFACWIHQMPIFRWLEKPGDTLQPTCKVDFLCLLAGTKSPCSLVKPHCCWLNTHTHTRQKLDHWSDPLGTESHNVQLDKIYIIKWPEEIDIYIYMRLKCDLNAPRCTTKAQQVRLHGSPGGVFVDHRPPIPCFYKNIIYKI